MQYKYLTSTGLVSNTGGKVRSVVYSHSAAATGAVCAGNSASASARPVIPVRLGAAGTVSVDSAGFDISGGIWWYGVGTVSIGWE